MKKIITPLLLLALLCSCNSKPEENAATKEIQNEEQITIHNSDNELNENIYSNDILNISFSYPKNWEVQTDSVNGVLFILSPTDSEDSFQEMMNIVVGGTKGLDLDEFLSINLTVVEEVFEELSLTEEPADTYINGKLFKKVKYNYVSEGYGYPLTASIFVTHANNNSYIVNCSALQNTFDDYQNQFMSVVNSIEIK